jgi:hypothetical protein
VVETYEHKIGPRNGARVVARAWTDPAYKQRLLTNGGAAILELGYGGAQGEYMVVVENSPKVHNLVVCTLCSCYPWPTLGLPPAWYKSSGYRSRAVIDPRGVLREFGLVLPDDVEIRVWDSTSEVRYLVLPERRRHGSHDGRGCGAGLARFDGRRRQGHAAADGSPGMNGIHDMGGMHGMGPIGYEKNPPVFHEPWEGRAWALVRVMGPWGRGRWRGSLRYELERIPPAEYLRMPYYERWFSVLVNRLLRGKLITQSELETGKPDPNASKPTLLPATGGAQNSSARLDVRVDTRFQGGSVCAPKYQSRRSHAVAALRPRTPRRGAEDHGVWALQDTDSEGDPLGSKPQHVYTVRFAA